MTYDTPLSPRPLSQLSDVTHRVVTGGTLREQGVSSAIARGRCQRDGPWQSPLPGVFVLHPDVPTDEERLLAVLLYAAGSVGNSDTATATTSGERPVISGLAALALHGFRSAPALCDIERIDVLLPRARRRRSTGWARIVRVQRVPEAHEIAGVPVAPVARALADAVGQLNDPAVVHQLLAETVRDGHCDVPVVVGELRRARLLGRPQVVGAVETLLAEGRALAESRLYELVRTGELPAPCWNVELRQPGGPPLGVLDAYWPEQNLGVEIDTRVPGRAGAATRWPSYARQRDTLARLGITVLSFRPEQLREDLAPLAQVVRTALVTAEEREPASYVLVEPR